MDIMIKTLKLIGEVAVVTFALLVGLCLMGFFIDGYFPTEWSTEGKFTVCLASLVGAIVFKVLESPFLNGDK